MSRKTDVWLFITAFVVVFTAETDAACGDVYDEVLSSCCPSNYTSLCCAGVTEACNATLKTMGVLAEPYVYGEAVTNNKPYCLQPWNSSACEGGYYFDPVSKASKPCPNGYYCSSNSLCIIPCPVGAYCVREELVNITDSSPALCKMAGVCCSSNSTPVYDAVHGYQCPGAAKLVTCPKGSYCPDVTTRITCPSGHQCREGSTEAQACPALVICPEGAESPIYGVSALLLIIALVLLFLLLLFLFNHLEDFRYYMRRLKQRRKDHLSGKKVKRFSLTDGIRSAIRQALVLDEPHELIEPKKYTIDIQFKDLGLKLKRGGLKVLQDVSGTMRSGELTAIMGPSGSGKTTLLNTLSGKAYYGIREGSVVINGSEVSNLDTFKTVTAFVPQEDIMHRTLTVRETLRYQAELRLPISVSRQEKEEKTQQVINLMKLRRVEDQVIGDEESRGISGGQRKRVNIGMELVCEPTLLFLDEPTSGLDSSSSLMVVDSLKTVAEHGRLTVVCIIHQPRYEIFSQFHKVLFLGVGGQTVFQGTVEEADGYFSGLGLIKPPKINPADFYMDAIDGTMKDVDLKPDELFEKWKQYHSAKTENHAESDLVKILDIENGERLMFEREEEFKPRKRPHVFHQFWTFLRREVRLQFRIIRTLFMDQFLVILAGGVLGAVRRNAVLREFYPIGTLTSLALALTAMLSASRCFGMFRPVFWREASSGINRLSYFVAVNIVQLPIIFITPLSFLSLMYALVAPRGAFSDFYLVVLGLQFASTGSGYMLSTIFNPKSSQIASVVFAFINAVLAGDAIWLCDLDNYTVIGPVLYNLSFSRWYLEGLMEKEALEYPRVLAAYVHHTITENGFTLNNFPVVIGALFAIGIGYRIIAFFCLIFVNRNKQV